MIGVKKPFSIRICKNIGASVGMGNCNKPQETFIASSEDKYRKLKMWVACCGCGNAQSLFENIYKMKAIPSKIVYYTRCPYCGFEHKLVVQKV